MILKSRKGIIEVSFSWIFILLAGTVILGLFVYIGFNQGNFFKTLINADMLKDLNAIFVAAQVSKNTAAIFSIPSTDLSFSCNSYGIEGVSHSLSGQFVFAPDRLDTDKIISWSKPWSLGFRITNFLYLTSPYIKYYIGYRPSNSKSAELAHEIYDDFPKHLTKELLPLDASVTIENQNYEKIIILLLDIHPDDTINTIIYDSDNFKNYQRDEIIFVYADELDTQTIEGSLMVSLYFKDKYNDLIGPPKIGSTYAKMKIYDVSSLYGAFISGNYEQTLCMLGRAFERAEDVVEVYNYRTYKFQNTICLYYYDSAREEFSKMLNNLRPADGNVKTTDLKFNIIQLIGLNELLETYSCPLIY